MPGAGISASSRRVCSGLLTGGAGAFRAFDRRLRSKIGPKPVPDDDADVVDSVLVGADGAAADADEVDATIIIGGGGGGLGRFGSLGDVGSGAAVDTTVVVMTGITSSGEVCPDVSCMAVRLISSPNKSSMRPMRCAIRCISRRISTFMSITEAIKSRCASELAVSRIPVS